VEEVEYKDAYGRVDDTLIYRLLINKRIIKTSLGRKKKVKKKAYIME